MSAEEQKPVGKPGQTGGGARHHRDAVTAPQRAPVQRLEGGGQMRAAPLAAACHRTHCRWSWWHILPCLVPAEAGPGAEEEEDAQAAAEAEARRKAKGKAPVTEQDVAAADEEDDDEEEVRGALHPGQACIRQFGKQLPAALR